MNEFSEVIEKEQLFLNELAMQHAIRTIRDVDPMDVAKLRYDFLRCSDEDLRETETAWDRDPDASPKFGLSWAAFAGAVREDIRSCVSHMVASHLEKMAWEYLSDPEGYPEERLAASLGMLVNCSLKAAKDEEYERQIRTTVASNKLNKRDLSLFLAGIIRGVSQNLVFVATSQAEADEDSLLAFEVLRDAVASIAAGKAGKEVRQRRRDNRAAMRQLTLRKDQG